MRPYVFCILLICLLMHIPACKGKSNVRPLRIGIINPSIDHLPLTLALEKNYLKAEKFRLVSFTSGWEVQEAISAGRIDLAIMPFTYAWTVIARGYNMKIVSALERETDGIISNTKYKQVTDLQNKKIGLLRASTLEILMQDAAKINGMEYEPVYFRTPTEMIAALQTEDIDAIVSYVPLIQKMGSDYHVLHWFSETYPGHPCCDLVASEYLATSQQKELKSILNALHKSASDITNPSEEVLDLISKLYGLNRQQAIDALKHTRFDVALTESDKQFERKMMKAFIDNSYLKELPAEEAVYINWDL